MSKEDVRDIIGLPIIGIIPDSEHVVTSSNRGEPLVLNEELSVSGMAFDNIARRLNGEKIEFLKFDIPKHENFFLR
jgi:septum site-determining protein MinD